jgi:hypothetical protein
VFNCDMVERQGAPDKDLTPRGFEARGELEFKALNNNDT